MALLSKYTLQYRVLAPLMVNRAEVAPRRVVLTTWSHSEVDGTSRSAPPRLGSGSKSLSHEQLHKFIPATGGHPTSFVQEDGMFRVTLSTYPFTPANVVTGR